MPIYEYQCDGCGHTLEALQKISDSPLQECPECGKSELRKLISAVSFHLKGTGWYATDFKDQGKAKEETKKEGEPKKDGESKKDESKKEGKKQDSSEKSASEPKSKETKAAKASKDK